MENKFNEDQRADVIRFLKERLDIALFRVDGFKILYKSNNGIKYCVIGGYSYWHGISQKVLDNIDPKSTILVVAIVHKSNIIVYANKIEPLVDNIKFLSKNAQDEYEFNSDDDRYRLIIKKVQGYVLSKLGEIDNGIIIPSKGDGNINDDLLGFINTYGKKVITRKKQII